MHVKPPLLYVYKDYGLHVGESGQVSFLKPIAMHNTRQVCTKRNLSFPKHCLIPWEFKEKGRSVCSFTVGKKMVSFTVGKEIVTK